MSKVAVIIDEGFEDNEYHLPAQALREAGHELTHIGLCRGAEVNGMAGKVTAHIDKALDETTAKDYDALLIPGGASPDHLRAHDEAVTFVKGFVDSGKPIFSICHGPQLLITAQALEGVKITGWKSIVQDLKNAGAEYINAEVVDDEAHNIISSRCPDDIPAFNKRILEKLQEYSSHAELQETAKR